MSTVSKKLTYRSKRANHVQKFWLCKTSEPCLIFQVETFWFVKKRKANRSDDFPLNKLHNKNPTHVKIVGHTSEFLFGIYWWTWKTTIHKKKLLKWVNKKCKNFNIFSIVFKKKKKRKTPGDIIILHLCTKNLDDIIYSSWDIGCDRLKLVIMGLFCPFTFLKTKKLEISFYTSVP